eukprot:TRINITY_DN3790_c0_g1_i1.p3 TRINITY_DN3790_c0_g1~~TRINITY_DN3790_c0_g1_i1.p3  ORF type:complete len:166 (-),score=26.09 TRINITY_DN3790_c0_g1_i1:175-672(-)
MATAYSDLSEFVDPNGLECLNARPDHTILNIFPPSGLLESDADPQLLLNINFKQSVKIHDLELVAPADGRRPASIKLFANQRVIEFSDAEEAPGTQQSPLDWKPHADGRMVASVATKFVKFQDVKSICIFFNDNVGDAPTTAVTGITFIGGSLANVDMKNLKKSG